MASGACQFFAVKTPKGNDFLGDAPYLAGILGSIRSAPRANTAHYEALC